MSIPGDPPKRTKLSAELGAPVDRGLSMEVIWLDDDVVELRIRACNGRFAATTDCYDGHEAMTRLAQTIRGFPTTTDDRRELVLGNLDPALGGGGARLALACVDAVGHVELRVELRSYSTAKVGDETASFAFPVEPAAIDAFVAELDAMSTVVGAGVHLRQAT